MKIAIISIIIVIIIAVAVVCLNRRGVRDDAISLFDKVQKDRNLDGKEEVDAQIGSGMKKYKYLSSDGGPFVLITSGIRNKWGGVGNILNPLDPKTDYGKVCGVIAKERTYGVESAFGVTRIYQSDLLVAEAPMLAMERSSNEKYVNIYLLDDWRIMSLDSMIDQCREQLENKAFDVTGKTLEFSSDTLTLMYAGDTYGECGYAFNDFQIQKGKYRLLKSVWSDPKLGTIVVLRLMPETPK